MVQTYTDIAARPALPGYPLVNQGGADDAQNAADFARILREHRSDPAAAANSAPVEAEGSSSFTSFLKGVIDVINPLQHIPFVGALYRHFTGDEISPMAHFIGDSLYGGPIGGAVAAADIAYQKVTGRDVGETMLASLTGKRSTAADDTAIAQKLDTDVAPAAGAASTPVTGDFRPAHENIVWMDPSVQTPETPLFPPSQASGTNGGEPASPLSSAQPALPKRVASTNTLQAQEAPDDAARTAASPELIASKMMEGLEKYAQMKRSSLAPTSSSVH